MTTTSKPSTPQSSQVASQPSVAKLSARSVPLVRLAAVAAVMLLAGCAGESSSGWPQASDFSRISQKVLTPAEQSQAIKSMTDEQKAEQDKAIKAIEGKK